MVTPHHLPKKKGALKSTQKSLCFLRGNFLVSHSNEYISKKYFKLTYLSVLKHLIDVILPTKNKIIM